MLNYSVIPCNWQSWEWPHCFSRLSCLNDLFITVCKAAFSPPCIRHQQTPCRTVPLINKSLR